MQQSERDRSPSNSEVGELTEEGPALRDATAAAQRAADDEAAAASTRERFIESPIPPIEPDESIAKHLLPDELVHTLRIHAILNAPGDDRSLGYGGTLYLTSRRLVHLGQVMVTMQLTDIVEASLAGERLLLTLRDGEGFIMDLDRPRMLRAEIAAATRALRR